MDYTAWDEHGLCNYIFLKEYCILARCVFGIIVL
jgi:hypothetical protein